MGTVVSVRFPLGHYHATPWDRNVNEGAVEWPPSPWRILRALVSTWYNRWPELPAPVLDDLLQALGEPPAYRTAPGRPGHTRHYLPNLAHRSGFSSNTDKALDPFLSLSREAEAHLLIRWEADLTGEQREVLGKLVELVPYLGRAEAVCEMNLLDGDVPPDDTWWRPGGRGDETVRLLAPTTPVSRPVLELSTVTVRKGRRTMPPDTRWVTYARQVPSQKPPRPGRRQPSTVEAIRFGIQAAAPFRATHGVLLADIMHRAVTKRLDGGRPELLGHGGAATDHQHAHWVPLPTGPDRGATIEGLLVWAPVGIQPEEVAAIIETRWLSGRRGGGDGTDGYELKGFPKTTLLLQSVGPVEQVAPELCGPSRTWRSLTPYLPVRHYKRSRGTYEQFLAEDVRRELAYRNLPAGVEVVRVPYQDGWAMAFRRYRAGEQLTKHARAGYGLRLTFAEPQAGPVMLGQLSHFGFGVFIPEVG
jgi:CRISPR-associated protein Csb2